MRFPAGRLASASRLLSCLAATTLALQLAACSSDSPTVLDPALVDSPSEALNFASGPVVAQVRSVPVPTYCIAVRIPTFANGTYTQLQLCKNTLAQQQFQLGTIVQDRRGRIAGVFEQGCGGLDDPLPGGGRPLGPTGPRYCLDRSSHLSTVTLY